MIPYKRSILNKIKQFFKRLFTKNKKEIAQVNNEKIIIDDVIILNQKNNNFKEKITIPKDIERERLLKLRQQWESGEIEEEYIDENDINAIVKIYDEETEQIKQETELIKHDIEMMLKKLKESV